MMIALIRTEFTKILHRRLNQIVLGVYCALLVFVYILLWMSMSVLDQVGGQQASGAIRSALYLRETVPFAMLMLYSFGFVSGVVVIGASIGSEYVWNTVRTVTAIEPRRSRVLFAKLLALWLACVGGLAVGFVAMLLTSSVITVAAGEFDLSFVDGPYVRNTALSFLRVLVVTGPYFSLAALFAVWGKSATAGISLAIGVAFLEGIIGGLMSLAGGWIDEIPKYMLDTNGDTIALANGGQLEQAFGAGSTLGTIVDRPSVEHAVIVLLVWTLVFLAGAFLGFHRQDLEYQG